MLLCAAPEESSWRLAPGAAAPRRTTRRGEPRQRRLAAKIGTIAVPRDAIFGRRRRLLAAQSRRIASPVVLQFAHGCLTRPERAARAVTSCLPESDITKRNVEAARHATRGCCGGAAPTAAWPRSAARRSGGRASGPSVPAGRRLRLGPPAAAARPRRALAPTPGRRSCAHGHRARLLTHEIFFDAVVNRPILRRRP